MALTPMMSQYLELKEKYKDCILFFRLGDFYEMFFEDAEIASKELELVLTGRDCGLENRAPMCGVPFHASQNYIGRLVQKGYKVAICEQVEDPALAKGIVKRDVIKIVTPGTFTDSSYIDESENNYVMSIFLDKEINMVGISTTDISTGEFLHTNFHYKKKLVLDEIWKLSPKEILLQDSLNDELRKDIISYSNITITTKNDDYFISLLNDYDVIQVDTSSDVVVKQSTYGLLNYIQDTQKTSLSNINHIEYYEIEDFMSIDSNSRRNLELVESIREKNKKGSLFWVLDKTQTAMGSRQLRKWIEQPLVSKIHIEKRLDSVEELVNNPYIIEEIREELKEIYDIERIVGKIASKSVNAKDLISLKNSLVKIPNILGILKKRKSALFLEFIKGMDDLSDITRLLESAILDEPSLSLKEGNIIKSGYNSNVDELREAKAHGKEWIARLENQERDFTGIRSLKVGYNKVFGYYIEISKANYASIPKDRYIRKQTLANAERFITEELKVMEEKILGSEEKLVSLEYEIFVDVREKIENEIVRLQRTAKAISELDCICCFAHIALEYKYVKPSIVDYGTTLIKEGRHPVVEKVIPRGEFISNDTEINNEDKQLLLITGPNMAGKSTYMRQVALITLMAHLGSFVPASSAQIAICDKIFTRIGASDDLAGGKSTFMVEMWEVSNILESATPRSLVLLDEVGRGTSTYDGLSIAWAVIEYICSEKDLKCKTLFATHYHELTRLEKEIKGVKNYSVAVKEINNSIIFLRKIVEGGADQSYGIEVAKLAGLPAKVVSRAKDLLASLEGDSSKVKVKSNTHIGSLNNIEEIAIDKHVSTKKPKKESEVFQINFTQLEKDDLLKKIASTDILSLTPMDAMNKLYDIIKSAKTLI